MDDQVVIKRDPEGTSDDGFNQETGTYVPPLSDVQTVYTGPAMFTLITSVGRDGSRGGGQFAAVGYKLSIPLEAPELKRGDWVEVTASLRDPELVGKRFQIDTPQYTTLAYVRRATLISEEVVGE